VAQKQRVEKGFALNQEQKTTVHEFKKELAQNPEGVSAEKEKFIHGMKTDCHKVLPPNKSE